MNVPAKGGRPPSMAKLAQKELRLIQVAAIKELAKRAAGGSSNALKILREIADEKPAARS
ncbi:hypothetical protein [Thiocystis violacea]|uniref:hypothetical protein n=1 Tax=Thiocystis violacea TaxID=13725 RepID=UPI0019069E36|nr:hypothetical protein [Thiocystis violacea]